MSSAPRPPSSDIDLIAAAAQQAQAARENAARAGLHGGSSGDAQAAARGELDAAGILIPGYTIAGERHSGGQGFVFQAVQESTRRSVALKVLREGVLADSGEQARFEREARILAQLRHPNIVTIHDSGIAAGRHYFVMDFIPGQPLDEYAAGRRLAARDALALMAVVCEAVNVAHLRGIIHRDLKPSNVRIDPGGQPHILDFGLAKVSEFDVLNATAASALTLSGQFVGSVPWASPEQASGDSSGIDIRTDVYSLGVMLYQLLTGQLPYDLGGTMRDALNRIATAEPQRPSLLVRGLDPDIETIVLKCLSKDRERRYQTAGDLARDIRRCLAGEPIEARRDSMAYVLRKQVKRHRATLAVAAAFVLVASGGLAASLLFWQRAERERDAAQESAAQARESAERAQTRADQLDAVQRFQRNMLRAADRGEQGGRELTVREVLDGAAAEIDAGSLAKEPVVEGKVRTTLGLTYTSLGLYEPAIRHLQRALDLSQENEPDTLGYAVDLSNLAMTLLDAGHSDKAEPLMKQSLESHRRLCSPDDPLLAHALAHWADLQAQRGGVEEAERCYGEALAIFQGADAEPLVLATVFSNRGELFRKTDRLPEAEADLQAALSLRRQHAPNNPVLANTLNNLALAQRQMKHPADAQASLREALELTRRLLGPQHEKVALVLCNLADVLAETQQFDEADELLVEALSIARQPGMSPGRLVVTLGTRAKLLRAAGRTEESETHIREAYEVAQKAWGADHPFTQTAGNQWTDLLLDRSALTDADSVLTNLCRAAPNLPPAYRGRLAERLRRLAEGYEAVGSAAEAAAARSRADELAPPAPPADAPPAAPARATP